MAFGYATFIDQAHRADLDGELIFESYHWQWPPSSVHQYRDYLADPADGIVPPEYSTHHNQMICLKYLEGYDYPEDDIYDNEVIREDAEGFIYWPGGTTDSVNTEIENLDASDRAAYLMGEVSEFYMRLVGLGSWIDSAKREQEQLHRQYQLRVPAPLGFNSRIEVTEDLLVQRHQVTEEQLYSNYLARRRERRNREQREF
jgi:hypothetical protein